MPISFNGIALLVWFALALVSSSICKKIAQGEFLLAPKFPKYLALMGWANAVTGAIVTVRFIQWIIGGFQTPHSSTLIVWSIIAVYYAAMAISLRKISPITAYTLTAVYIVTAAISVAMLA